MTAYLWLSHLSAHWMFQCFSGNLWVIYLFDFLTLESCNWTMVPMCVMFSLNLVTSNIWFSMLDKREFRFCNVTIWVFHTFSISCYRVFWEVGCDSICCSREYIPWSNRVTHGGAGESLSTGLIELHGVRKFAVFMVFMGFIYVI